FHKPKLAGQDVKGLVGLEHIATSQGGSYAQHCKKPCQYFSQSPKVSFFQPIPQVFHRSPKYLPLRIYVPIFYTEGTFTEFCAHAQQPGNDHPKSCPGTTH